jgi:cellulose synthase/poly-beta-1,6-N-acetylglucosamine synthase-like glycosyltransferase
MIAAQVVLGVSVGLAVYAYVGYPLLLFGLSRSRPPRASPGEPAEWPLVTITVPAYNEEASIGATLDRLLDIDYPADRRHVLVVSDASSDRTDEIVRGYADRGVELLRMTARGGKTAAENAARSHALGSVLINTDASVRLDRNCLKPLVAELLADPAIGVASGRDVSVTNFDSTTNLGESGYVNYEMRVRELETRVGGIVGASGCLYAIRPVLHGELVPDALSRDFASALIAREHGMRAVAVHESICYVPRAPSLRREYRRKVRTMARGIETLWYKRRLLNPLRFGTFAWMLWSHKVARWLVPWALLAGGIATIVLAADHWWARAAALAGLVTVLLGVAGWAWPEGRNIPRGFAVPAYALSGNMAALVASIKAMRGELNPVWEPTRRGNQPAPPG